MPLIDPVPNGSIYVWCYVQGLKGVSWDEILSALSTFGVEPRYKDRRNWEDGMRKHLKKEFVYESRGFQTALLDNIKPMVDPRVVPDLDSYPLLSCDNKWYEDTRWIPCNKDNKPLVRWSETRCKLNEARLWPNVKYLAENLKGCRWIVLDFDVDHDKDDIDYGLREFGLKLLKDFPTQAIYKDDWMGFHLTYWTDREINTKHLPHVKIDICGNSIKTSGQLRYFKTKKANEVSNVRLLTEDMWRRIQEYSLSKEVYRKKKVTNELIY